jgi:hypothetical protein
MRRVVDTNVPIVANGRNSNASVDCRLAAIEFLQVLIGGGRILLDLDGEIQEEYRRYLNPHGQPGVGDRFFLMILLSAPSRVDRVQLDIDPLTGEYSAFPHDPALAKFDPSDRKFAAVARSSGVPVANATDADWLEHRIALAANGIEVHFVCGCDPEAWTNEK